MFFTNGVLFSALLPRYPEVKAAFGLSNTAFGLVVVAFPVGAVVAAAVAAPMIRWLGARRVVAVGSVLLAAAMAGAGAAPAVGWFVAALVVGGMVDAVVDAAQNVHGVAVEQWLGRSVINSLHAVWSLGAATGGAIGAWAAATGIGLAPQMLVNGLVWSVVVVLGAALAATPRDGPAETAPPPGPAAVAGPRPWRLLAPLVVLAICGTLVEDVANNWVVLYLGQVSGAPTAVAGLGFTVVLVCQFVGRLLGDPVTDRWGRAAVARAGGLLVAAGVVLAAAWPAAALVGFGLCGFGCATLVPAAFAAAGRVPGLGYGTGIAVLGWLMRIGFLATSPAVGAISDAAGLRVALVLPFAAGIVAAFLARRLRA